MRKVRFLFTILMIVGLFWFFYGEKLKESGFQAAFSELKSDVTSLKNSPEVSSGIEKLKEGVGNLLVIVNDKLDSSSNKEHLDDPVQKPLLATPTQAFSIHNIELGDSKTDVESQIGAPKRSSLNEYGVDWHTYHENYQNFFMVAYDDQGKVAGLYTNQDLISSKQGLKLGAAKDTVLSQLGKPLTKIQKGFAFYQINNPEYDTFHIEKSYVTVFYDKHENNTVTALQIISDKLEANKKEFFGEPSPELEEGFEYQLFDLTNASRVNHGLSVLSWNEAVRKTARDHSNDMAVHNYFNHTNLDGESPFDRMEADAITFRMAGENLAAGQQSSIFAHEGLMNSLGHRENKLRPEYQELGVGVDFNSESRPYFTENYVTK
ncbi:CAP domain-containing protein [Bacillus cihuensis]|uniref:CAP domain-containing protein n=1 Tax=Bacillus cihuensis TaxID=1208599 RepID=UPI00040EBA5A|nr:CAP domain-containing protein [Bacillus cihuensis]